MKHEPVLNILCLEMAKYRDFEGVKLARCPVVLSDGTWFTPDCDATELQNAWFDYINNSKKKVVSPEATLVMRRFKDDIIGIPSALLLKDETEVALQLIDDKIDGSFLIASNGMPLRTLYFSRDFIIANIERVLGFIAQALWNDNRGSKTIKLGQSTFLISH